VFVSPEPLPPVPGSSELVSGTSEPVPRTTQLSADQPIGIAGTFVVAPATSSVWSPGSVYWYWSCPVWSVVPLITSPVLKVSLYVVEVSGCLGASCIATIAIWNGKGLCFSQGERRAKRS